MIVGIPIGLWVFSLVSDIIYAAGWGGLVWNDVAYYTMVGGVIGALIAAVPGFIDYLSIVVLYVINIIIRTNGQPNMALPIILSVVAIGALLYSGWLGGDMVYEHGMGVGLEPDGKLSKGRPRPYEAIGIRERDQSGRMSARTS